MVDKDKIMRLLKKYFRTTGKITIDDEGLVSCKGNVELKSVIKLERLPVAFDRVGGNFWCYNNQLTTLQGFSQGEMVNYLTQQGVPNSTAINLAQQSQGNMNKALDLLAQDSEEQVFGQWMVQWIRSAFKAKTQKSAVQELMMWSQEVAKVGRETQKNFLMYALSFFREAMLANYGMRELCHLSISVPGFDFEKFVPFIHENNIASITQSIDEAIYHIERNGNGKMILADLALQLTRMLHAKASV